MLLEAQMMAADRCIDDDVDRPRVAYTSKTLAGRATTWGIENQLASHERILRILVEPKIRITGVVMTDRGHRDDPYPRQ